jgi:ATP-dependent DNA helicase RecQ
VKQVQHRLKDTPIVPKQNDNGKIKLVRYQSSNLITPLVHDILKTDLKGTTCVLTKTNEEALQITGLLLKNKMQAKLVQTNDVFSLYNLLEVRFFLGQLKLSDDVFIISDDLWENAKRELIDKFRGSTKLEICLNIIKDFEATNPKKKYKSDLEVFIRESKLEDFFNENGETIFVSTIHKAKGKEFDNVFLMLENFNAVPEDAKRQLYVAMTRAKQNLTVHLNSNILDNFSAENLERIEDSEIYLPPEELVMNLIHSDVNLGYFEYVQHRMKNILPGDSLFLVDDGCANSNGDLVLKFAKKFLETIEIRKQNGYELKSVKVNFIVYWLKDGAEEEVKIVLPELYFEKQQNGK